MATSRNIVLTQSDYVRLAEMVQRLRYAKDTETRTSARQIQRDLDDAHVVPPDHVPQEVITMDSRVQFLDIDTKTKSTYTVVWPDEACMDEGRVSVLAPIGLALLGCQVGDEVDCHTPAGVRRLRITEVLYQPEVAARDAQAESVV